MAASFTSSRFALLTVEDSDEEQKNKKTKGSQSAGQKKKKNKKQKSSKANEDLRSLAFGGSSSGNKASSSKQEHQKTFQANGKDSSQYEQWKEHDSDIVNDMFEKELQQAILASKVEHERKMEILSTLSEATHDQSQTAGSEQVDSKKKKKNNKKKAMTIAEFQQNDEKNDKVPDPQTSDVRLSSSVSSRGDNFFEEVDQSAARVIRQDKMQDEYIKQFKVQAVLQSKHSAEMEEKDKIIIMLKEHLLEAQEELKQVKKRNKQLCFILGQGEMKEKAEILEQVDSLTTVKDELTTQLSTLTSELEKEKSKVHSLQNELTKLKSKGK